MQYRALTVVMLLALLPLSIAARGPQEVTEDASQRVCEADRRPFVDGREITICVPDVPQRIVATHGFNAGAHVLSLGGPLIGIASSFGELPPAVTHYFDLDGIVDVGHYGTPNIELIVALQPDLIVTPSFSGIIWYESDETLNRLESIAPVVGIEPLRPVEEVMADYTELLGEAATVSTAEQREAFESVLEEIRTILGDDWERVTVGFISGWQGEVEAYGPARIVTTDILNRIGASFAPIHMEAAARDDGYIGPLSYEVMDAFSGDLVMVDTFNSPDLRDHELVLQLPAVRSGQVIYFDGVRTGAHYTNYIAVAKKIRDDVLAMEHFDIDLVFTDEDRMIEDAVETSD